MPVLPRFDVQGQIALVTGAARGLGRAIAWPWQTPGRMWRWGCAT